jgi:DNA-binding beta-propeller fold protein YncE
MGRHFHLPSSLSKLSPLAVLAALAVAAAPAQAGPFAYVANSSSNNVSQYDVGAGGALTPKSPATVAAGTGPQGVAVSPNGASVYITNVNSGTVSQYDVGAGGALTPKSPATVATGTGPQGVAVSPNGASVYVANFNSNSVSQYDVGPNGALTPKSPATVAAGSLPRGVAVSPNGASVYVTNLSNNSVSQYDVGAGGVLTPKSPATVAAGNAPQRVAVSPNGASVYVTNSNSANVSQYDVGAGGVLTAKSPATVAAGGVAREVAVSLGPVPFPIPASAPEVRGSLVQVFKQCGTGGNPVNAKHAPSLSLGSCNPPLPVSPNARVGNGGAGSVTMTVLPGDYQVAVADTDIRTPSGADYDPNAGSSPDITVVAKLRVTDTRNCTPAGCGGPYTQSATTTDFDFSVPVACVANGSATTPPGSDCNLTTTVNSVASGTLVAGAQTSVTVFRVRVNDHLGALFQQQGSFVP